MNVVDCYVKKVLKEPFFAWGKWWVSVIADSYGRSTTTAIMCGTEEEAKAIGVGHHFLA